MPTASEWFDSKHSWETTDPGWRELYREVLQLEVTQKKESALIDFVNEILGGENYLNSGYEIRGEVVFEIPSDKISSAASKNLKKREELLNQLSSRTHIYLWDKRSNGRVEIEDVGVGISQVIPVLAASWDSSGIVHIQQPEIHLHPALQAQLADAFIRCVRNARSLLILESHSEHLMLRLLRRIRETAHRKQKGQPVMPSVEASDSFHDLSADKVSVIYVSKDMNGLTVFKRLRLSPDGEFLDRWPNGFFADRDRELFTE